MAKQGKAWPAGYKKIQSTKVDNFMVSDKDTKEIGYIDRNDLVNSIEITGELIDPIAPGTAQAPAVIPAGPAGQKRKFTPAPGFYIVGGVTREVTSDKRWDMYWNNTAWQLIDLGELPINPAIEEVRKGSTEPISSGAIYSQSVTNIEKNSIVETELLNGNVYGANSPWTIVLPSTGEYLANNGDFKNGNYFQQIKPTNNTNGIGSTVRAFIPVIERNIGRKIRYYFSYKSDKQVEFKIYFQNENGWLNNAGSSTLICSPTPDERSVYIERNYEAGAIVAFLYINVIPSATTLKVGNVRAVAVGQEIKQKKIVTETSIVFGKNPAFENQNLINIGIAGGTSKVEVIANEIFPVGKFKTVLTAIGGNITNSYFQIPLPERFWSDTTRRIRVSLAYINTGAGLVQYQLLQRSDSAWTVSLAQYPAVTIPKTLEVQYLEIEADIRPNTRNICLCFQVASGATFQIGSVRHEVLGVSNEDKAVRTTYIELSPITEQPDLIRSTIKGLVNPNANNRYIIVLNDGIYDEIDITGTGYNGNDPSVVTLRAKNRYKAEIFTDGKSTRLSPAGYSYPVTPAGSYNNVPINTIPQVAKHTFYLQESMLIDGVKIRANDVKYPVHQDNTRKPYRSLFKNCHVIHEELTSDVFLNVIGIGASENQHPMFEDVICELRTPFDLTEKDANAIYWHNWNNRPAPASLKAINVQGIGCNIAHISELSSTQNDIVTIEGCGSNLPTASVKYSLTPGQYTPEPSDLNDYPYNITLDIKNTDVKYMEWINRSKAGMMAVDINGFHVRIRNTSGANLPQGTAVKIDYSKDGRSVILANSNDFDFIVWRDIANNSDGFGVPKGKSMIVACEANAYVKGDLMTINSSGLFSKTTNRSIAVGVVYSPRSNSLALVRTFE